MRPLILVTLIAVIALWNAALAAAPAGEPQGMSALTYAAGSLVCHQLPTRSFRLGAAQYPVCARCAGLYLGALVGGIAWALFGGVRRPRGRAAQWLSHGGARRVLLYSAVPTAVSLALAWAGLWDASNAWRAVSALPLGAAAAAIVVAVSLGDLR